LDTELGYIVPAGPPTNGLLSVAEFVEKPARTHAAKLIAAGALWNTFMLVANGRELLELLRAREPAVVAELHRALERGTTPTLREIYCRLPVLDFSRDVVQRNPPAFSAIRMAACGWTDLGTVDRVRKSLGLRPKRFVTAAAMTDAEPAPISLARALWAERLPAHASCDLTDELGVGAVEMMPAG
jgi:mannose-1-phosphate guanylyltransferase